MDDTGVFGLCSGEAANTSEVARVAVAICRPQPQGRHAEGMRRASRTILLVVIRRDIECGCSISPAETADSPDSPHG